MGLCTGLCLVTRHHQRFLQNGSWVVRREHSQHPVGVFRLLDTSHWSSVATWDAERTIVSFRILYDSVRNI